MSFMLRRNTKNFNDVNHNFHVVDWLLRGHIDSSNINSVEAVKIEGTLQADQVVVGEGTSFEEGYDYRGKVTQLTNEGVYTGKVYANQIEVAGFEQDDDGKTTIKGGYINTDVLEANSIEADKLRVNDLSAVSAYFTELYTGSASDFVYIYEEDDRPYINFYDANTLRMGLSSDRMQLFTSMGAYGGVILGEEDPDYGLPSITMASPFMSRILSRDPLEDTLRSSGMATRVHVGDLLLPPELQLYAVDQYTDGATVVNTSCFVELDSHGDSIDSPYGNITLGGITRIKCIDPVDMAKGYRLVKGPIPSGSGIINFICEE